LDPLLTRDDVRTIANGRFASSIDSVDGEERWIYSWVRHPETIDRPINLELRFRDDRLCALALDPRFSQILGDARIEMLMRSFTSRITDLNLKAREIRCQVPLDSLARFAPLGASELMGCFGRSNYSRNTEIPGNRRHVYRYLLQGTEGDKAKMSFSGYLDFRRDLATAVSARIGSFSLILDFQEERNRAGGGVPATASTGP
ncbi:MAG: hypothetical protein KC488_12065, partial [Candidatus Cloacimonetes bacterium]|nr:hypothetical protein [Candidatus Cloacimonadota bacterium]